MLKCYQSALEKLACDNPPYKGKLTKDMRKQLTKAVRCICAIILHSREKNQPETIVMKLERDLLNGPLHCFGYHSKCISDFCTTVKVKQLAQYTSSSSSENNINSGDNNSSGNNTFSECNISSSSSSTMVDNNLIWMCIQVGCTIP